MKIFISHLSRNKSLVREFSSYLPSFLHPWIDEDVLCWGESFEKKIYWQITWETDFLISFIDKCTLKSEWVARELEWALDIERALDRTIILPIIMDDVSSLDLPAGLTDRIYLNLRDFSKNAVENLAKEAVMKLFQIVLKSYSSNRTFRIHLYDLTKKQKQILEYLSRKNINQGNIDKNEQTLETILNNLELTTNQTELYYRLETLIAQGLVKKYVNRTGGPYVYEVTYFFEKAKQFDDLQALETKSAAERFMDKK